MSKVKEKLNKLPTESGVYIFRDKSQKILYIGKATNLRSRTQSYFRGVNNRGAWIASMVEQIVDVDFIETDSVLEALILESNLIKKHQPKYNTDFKDDKSFSYFVITEEEFPKIIILRATDLNKNKNIVANKFGPYTSKKQMEIALKIIRRIFPFHSNKQKTEKGCLDFQLGLCSGPYADAISKIDYKKNIQGIRLILEGKKKRLITNLEKEMKAASKGNEFEKAVGFRNKIFALKHIQDVALISSEPPLSLPPEKGERKMGKTFRIEAYDISNISGTNAVGSMVVFNNNESDKSQYRKFKIKTVEGSNDVGMMREVLLRRFHHTLTCPDKIGTSSPLKGEEKKEKNFFWPMPDLILLDGGRGHLAMCERLLESLGIKMSVIAVAKGPTRKISNFKFLISNKFTMTKFPNDLKDIAKDRKLLGQIMDEAHRFAINYHRKLRKVSFLDKTTKKV